MKGYVLWPGFSEKWGINLNRKKELKEWYKQMKPEMGVFIIRSKFDNKCFLQGTQDLKSAINSIKFKLELGNHPNKKLQKDWQRYGKDNFAFQILENLDYDKDETKTDYTEDLDLLKMIWEEKLVKEGMEFY